MDLQSIWCKTYKFWEIRFASLFMQQNHRRRQLWMAVLSWIINTQGICLKYSSLSETGAGDTMMIHPILVFRLRCLNLGLYSVSASLQGLHFPVLSPSTGGCDSWCKVLGARGQSPLSRWLSHPIPPGNWWASLSHTCVREHAELLEPCLAQALRMLSPQRK